MSQHLLDRPPLLLEPPPRMSYEEFIAWKPDSIQAEWVDGEVIVLTVGDRHVELTEFFTTFLGSFVRLRRLGRVFPAPYQMRLAFRPSGREPDVMVLLSEHLDRVKGHWIEGPADFVVEVLSPETARTDLDAKLHEYELAGVPEYLMVDSRRGRHEFRFVRLGPDRRYGPVVPDDRGRYHSEVLPGAWFEPPWFQQRELPDPARLLFLMAREEYLKQTAEWLLESNDDSPNGASS